MDGEQIIYFIMMALASYWVWVDYQTNQSWDLLAQFFILYFHSTWYAYFLTTQTSRLWTAPCLCLAERWSCCWCGIASPDTLHSYYGLSYHTKRHPRTFVCTIRLLLSHSILNSLCPFILIALVHLDLLDQSASIHSPGVCGFRDRWNRSQTRWCSCFQLFLELWWSLVVLLCRDSHLWCCHFCQHHVCYKDQLAEALASDDWQSFWIEFPPSNDEKDAPVS